MIFLCLPPYPLFRHNGEGYDESELVDVLAYRIMDGVRYHSMNGLCKWHFYEHVVKLYLSPFPALYVPRDISGHV